MQKKKRVPPVGAEATIVRCMREGKPTTWLVPGVAGVRLAAPVEGIPATQILPNSRGAYASATRAALARRRAPSFVGEGSLLFRQPPCATARARRASIFGVCIMLGYNTYVYEIWGQTNTCYRLDREALAGGLARTG